MIPEWLARRWCAMFHTGAMLPLHGQYTCPTCQIKWPCIWDLKGADPCAISRKIPATSEKILSPET